MKYKIILLFILFTLSTANSQDYYNKVIDVREGQRDKCFELESHDDFLYTRSLENDIVTGASYTRISKLDLEGNVVNTVIFDSLYTTFSADRCMQFNGDTLLILASNPFEKQIDIQYCSTDLENLGRYEYFLDIEGTAIFVKPLVQNQDYLYITGYVYFDEEFPIKNTEGLIIRIEKSTMAIDNVFTYTHGTTNFSFKHPQIDELGNLSISYDEWNENDGIFGSQYGVIKFDEGLNILWNYEIPFHEVSFATAHHFELNNGNIVFADQGRDTLLSPASLSAALHCTNTSGNQMWRREEFILSNEVLSHTTRHYADGFVNQEGNLILASYYYDPYTSIEARLICVSPSGELLWERLYDSPTPDWDNFGSGIAGLEELSNGDIVIYGAQAPDFSPNDNHWLIKVNSFGCLEPGCELTSIEEVQKEEQIITVNPNLVRKNSSIFIEAVNVSEIKELSLMLYSIKGELMKTENITLSNSQNQIDVGNLPVGSYILVVSDAERVIQTEKIVVVE